METELSRNAELRVVRKRGSFGELRVEVDGQDVYSAGALRYPSPASVIARIERHLAS